MFGSLKTKFKRWQDAGLISADQTVALLAFEKERKSGKLVRDLTVAGVFAILLGVLSLVAANWQGIPPALKIIGHFILNIGVMVYMLRLDPARRPITRDACVLGLFGLFLTFIALIGQVFQLHGGLHNTILFWLAICTPFIWQYGRTFMVALPWLGVVLWAIILNVFYYVDRSEDVVILIATTLSLYLPPLMLLASTSPWIKERRPNFAKAFRRVGIYLPAIVTTFAVLKFYNSYDIDGFEYFTHQIVLLVAGLLAIFFIFRPKDKADQDSSDLWYYLLVSGMITTLPFAFPMLESGALSALLFILYWIFIAWLGARMQAQQLTDWAIRLVILRLFIVYVEVFGSMILTGAGLIASGVILLVILRYLNRIVAVGRKWVTYEIR